MTEDEYREKQARGQAARALLDHETFNAAFDAVSADLIGEWTSTAPGSVSLREEKHAEVRGLQRLKTRLQGWVDDAQFSAVTLEKQRR